MYDKLPPLLQDYADYFDTSPVLAVLLGVLVVVIAIALLRVAMKLFVFFLLLLAVALVASYFFVGEEATNDALRRGAKDAGAKVEEVMEKGQGALDDRLLEEYKAREGDAQK
ncbi:MAG: hypothetical protein QM477_06065 [Planctomycetota bacterium]